MTVRVPELTDEALLIAVEEDSKVIEMDEKRKRKIPEEDGNDTTDSGFQLSDGS